MRWLVVLFVASLLLLASARDSVADSYDTLRDLPETELKSRIFAWLDANAERSNLNVMRSQEPAVLGMVYRRYDCLSGDATGNADKGWSLAQDFRAVTYGGPTPFWRINDRYWVGAVCRHHYCPEKGAIIADIETGQVHFAMRHEILWYRPFKHASQREPRGGLVTLLADPAIDADSVGALHTAVDEWLLRDPGPFEENPRRQIFAMSCRHG